MARPDNSILFLMPSPPIATAVKRCLQEMKQEFPVFTAFREAALAIAREYLPQGTRVIVTYGETARRVRRQTEAYVVEVKYDGVDLLRTVRKTLARHERIAIVGFKKFVYTARQIAPLIATPLRIEEIHSDEEAALAVKNLSGEGVTAFIGGSVAGPAREAGFDGVTIEIDRQAILDAINESLRMLRLQQEKDARLGTTVTILNAVSEGIIGIGRDGCITEMNNVARQFLGDPGSATQPRHYSELLGQVDIIEQALRKSRECIGETLSIAGNLYTIDCTPIVVGTGCIGAVVTLREPLQIQTLERKIRHAYRHDGRTAKSTFADLAGNSPAMARVKKLAATFAAADSTVLIYGETGTGKELMAQGIHNASARADAPFVAINCAALPENLLESELFGYVRGAFTGASAGGKMGLFEIANSGTIFLDEIGEMALSLQSRLLRVLQEKEIWRIGDSRTTRVDIRVIAATNRDLAAMAAAGQFREDLYYRLGVLVLTMPPLRERLDDLRPLADRILEDKGRALKRPTVPLSDEAIGLLAAADWPGNVRQLANVLERALVMTRGRRIALGTLRESLESGLRFGARPPPDQPAVPVPVPPLPPARLGRVSDAVILQYLSACNGNRKETAQALGMSPTTLWRRLTAIRNATG
ncbi:MAG: sigma 54-interacting transcriptional regulator [Planctomycetes bacterium]|nr:sigma 54-interacting transcriptional regulator [Planctomycetota bacterium]